MSLKTAIANKALKIALPNINRKISKAIQQKGLDPYQHVMHYEETLGKIGDASASVSLSLNNLRGISSIQLEQLKFSEIKLKLFSDKDATAAGTFAINFSHDLTLDVEGEASAKVYLFKTKESIDANITNSGSTITGEADFVLGSLKKLEIKAFHLNTLNWQMGDTQVNVEGSLGMFAPLANKLIAMVTDKFNSELSGQISSALKMAIQEAVNGVLPMALKE